MEQRDTPRCDAPAEAASTTKQEQKELPKLSAKEFKILNRMSEHMNYFHDHFRQIWNTLHSACASGVRPAGMSLRTFLRTAEEFVHSLTIHHTIEEQHIFPILARKMPVFAREMELLTQHKQIHAGLDRLEEYLGKCKSGETEFQMREMLRVLDSFGEVLWDHLDNEVRQLGAENMRKYWSLDEMRRMPM